jgi:hypothetical protein
MIFCLFFRLVAAIPHVRVADMNLKVCTVGHVAPFFRKAKR